MSQKIGVGQIWQDWDIRNRVSIFNRFIKIKSISKDGLYAYCENTKTGRKTKIRCDRFKPDAHGYKLIK